MNVLLRIGSIIVGLAALITLVVAALGIESLSQYTLVVAPTVPFAGVSLLMLVAISIVSYVTRQSKIAAAGASISLLIQIILAMIAYQSDQTGNGVSVIVLVAIALNLAWGMSVAAADKEAADEFMEAPAPARQRR